MPKYAKASNPIYEGEFKAKLDFSMESFMPEVIESLEQACELALTAIGMTCERYAAINCPVDTGRLRASITNKVQPSEKTVYVGTNVEYAPYVELGSSKRKAHPYLRPAVENHINEYKKIINNTLKG